MTTLYCLSLIIYMEARGEPLQTQHYVGSVAIERAKVENQSICASMKLPKSYSWMWDGKNTIVDKQVLESKIFPIASQELKRPSMVGRRFFNEASLGKLWASEYNPIRPNKSKLIFY